MKSCFLCLTKKKKDLSEAALWVFKQENIAFCIHEVICYKAMLSNKKRPTVLWEQQILPSKRSTSQK